MSINKERLLILADYLEGVGYFKGRGVPANKFDLELWMGAYNAFSKEFDIKPKEGDAFKTTKIIEARSEWGDESISLVHPIDCQTAGCAVGWAATIPEFNNQGFYLGYVCAGVVQPIYIQGQKTYKDGEAVREFFNITSIMLTCLFIEDRYENSRDPIAVAKRIRELCAINNEDYDDWYKKYSYYYEHNI